MLLHSCQKFGSKSVCALLYAQLWPLWLYYIFPHYHLNGNILGENVTEHKMWALIFLTNLSKTFLSL